MLVIAAALFCAGSVTASADEGSHSHPVCGAECTGHPDGTTHDTNVEFQPLSELTPYTGPSGYHYQIESGCYYLTQDLQLEENGSILITGHVTLCLNGKCLNWADGSSGSIYANAITIGEGCSLTICDCDGSQVHDYVCKKDETNYDYVELATETDEGAKSVTGGLIIGNGNPLLFVRDYAQLNLYGGNYVDGHKSWDLYGGLITYTYGAKVRLYGGYMEANCGAVGINCQGGGPDAGLYLYGGTLTGSCRRKIDVNGNFYLYGGLITDAPDAQWYDGFVWDDCHIYVNGSAYLCGGALSSNRLSQLLRVDGTLYLKDAPVFCSAKCDIWADHIVDQGYTGGPLCLTEHGVSVDQVLVTGEDGVRPDPKKYVLSDGGSRTPSPYWRLDFTTESYPGSGVVRPALRTITWYDEDGTTVLTGPQYPNQVEVGSALTLPTPEEKEGEIFLGWRYHEFNSWDDEEDAYSEYWRSWNTVYYDVNLKAVFAHKLENIGTETAPIYLISNAEDLNAFFELQFALDESDNNSWDARYEQYFGSNVTYLVADENGDPISFTANAFDMAGQEPCVMEAVFDGNNSTILFASETFRYGWAFIVYNCGEIKDLTLEYRNCTWDRAGDEEIMFGGIALENAGLIRNCGVRGSLKVVNSVAESDSDLVSFMYFGGIACVDLGVIQNCCSTLDLDAQDVRFNTSTDPNHEYEFNFGGIAGTTTGFLYNCYAAGELNCDPAILALDTVLGGNYDQTCGIGTVVGSLITGAEPLLEWPGGWITYRDELASGSNYGVGDRLIGTVIDLGTVCDDWDLINTMSDMLDMYRYPDYSNYTDEEFKEALETEFASRYGRTLQAYLDHALQVLYPDGQLASANMVSALTGEDMQAETGLLRTLNGNREGHPQLAEWYLRSNENGGYPLLTPGNGSNSPSGGSGASGGNTHSPALPGSVPGNVYAGDPFCNGGANCPIHHFADANTSLWYHKALDYVVVKGIMNGVGSDRFDPAGEFQRCMLVTMLARLDGVDTADGSTWYEKGVQWAMANGISDGTNPTASITREQIAAMLYRYAGLKGYDISARGDLTAFADGGKTSGWAIESMRWAVGCGILQGAGVHLDPTGTATRAEVAQMLMNFCRLVQTAA